jgi:hypothetical protein
MNADKYRFPPDKTQRQKTYRDADERFMKEVRGLIWLRGPTNLDSFSALWYEKLGEYERLGGKG